MSSNMVKILFSLFIIISAPRVYHSICTVTYSSVPWYGRNSRKPVAQFCFLLSLPNEFVFHHDSNVIHSSRVCIKSYNSHFNFKTIDLTFSLNSSNSFKRTFKFTYFTECFTECRRGKYCVVDYVVAVTRPNHGTNSQNISDLTTYRDDV